MPTSGGGSVGSPTAAASSHARVPLGPSRFIAAIASAESPTATEATDLRAPDRDGSGPGRTPASLERDRVCATLNR